MSDVTIGARICYAAIYEPRDPGDGKPAKYQVTALIDKSDADTKNRLVAAAKECFIAKFGQDSFSRKPDGWSGINDGDKRTKPNANFDGKLYVNAKSSYKPFVADEYKAATTKVYNGCYCNVVLQPYAYEYMGSRRVGWGFKAVQFTADGEKIEYGSAFDPNSLPDVAPAPSSMATGSSEMPVDFDDFDAL